MATETPLSDTTPIPQPALQPPPPPSAREVTISDLVSGTELPPRPRVGRPKGSGKKKLVPSRAETEPEGDPEETQPASSAAANEDQISAMSATLFGGVTGALAMSLGEEWLPQPGEKRAMEQGIADYIRAQKWQDIPPRTALLLLCFFYAAPRFKPGTKTHERVKLGMAWIKSKIADFRARRKAD